MIGDVRAIFATAVLIASCACGTSGRTTEKPSRLRITTHTGLVPMEAGVRGTFTLHLANLVFALPSEFFETEPVVDGARVTFKVKPGSPRSALELAALVRTSGKPKVTSGDGIVVLEFPDPAAVQLGMDDMFVEVGPYRMASFTEETKEHPARLVLERTDARARFREIEVTAVGSEEEEWRRFLAGDADMIPQIAPSYVKYLEDVATVRMKTFQVRSRTGILFRVEPGPIEDAEVRRALSLAIRRKPLAQYAVGDASMAIETMEDSGEARRLLASHRERTGKPLALRFLVFPEASDMTRTALAVEQQLASFDVTIEWTEVRIEHIQDWLGKSGTFDGIIFPGGGWEERFWKYLRSGNTVTKYANPEMDDAIARKDEAAVRALVERDAPMTPLYSAAQYLVADARLCGITPESPSNLGWLADVHYCGEGE